MVGKFAVHAIYGRCSCLYIVLPSRRFKVQSAGCDLFAFNIRVGGDISGVV